MYTGTLAKEACRSCVLKFMTQTQARAHSPRQCLRKQHVALVHHRAQCALKQTAGVLGRWQGAHRQVQKPTAKKGREVATFSTRSLAVQSLLPGPCRDMQPRLRSEKAPTPSYLLGLPLQPEGAARHPADT